MFKYDHIAFQSTFVNMYCYSQSPLIFNSNCISTTNFKKFYLELNKAWPLINFPIFNPTFVICLTMNKHNSWCTWSGEWWLHWYMFLLAVLAVKVQRARILRNLKHKIRRCKNCFYARLLYTQHLYGKINA